MPRAKAKARRTAKQIAAARKNLERARRLENRAKVQFTRSKALYTLQGLGENIGKQSPEKASNKWKSFHMASIGVKPVGKGKRHLSHDMALKAMAGTKVH